MLWRAVAALVLVMLFVAVAVPAGAQDAGDPGAAIGGDVLATGTEGDVFGFQVTEARVAFTMLAALVSTVVVSLAAKPSTKGWQKTALNLGCAAGLALGSWFVDRFGTNEYVIQVLSIFVVASGIYFANQGGFRSLTSDVGRK